MTKPRPVTALVGLSLAASLLAAAPVSPGRDSAPGHAAYRPVVIAVLDDSLNVSHPVFRREGADAQTDPASRVAGYPAGVPAARFNMTNDRTADHDGPKAVAAYAALQTGFAWVPGTNIIGAKSFPDYDDEPITAPAGSSQHGSATATVAVGGGLSSLGTPYSPSPNSLLVFVDVEWTGPAVNFGAGSVDPGIVAGLQWVAQQDWIDVVSMSLGNALTLVPPFDQQAYLDVNGALLDVLESGKLVAIAAGNAVLQPSWAGPIDGTPGTLLVGANDNCGPTIASNAFPHVVADGASVPVANAYDYGERMFSGTSASAPRIAGFAAEAIRQVNARLFANNGNAIPPLGPLADRELSPAELHDALRATAVPHSVDTPYDGEAGTLEFTCMPVDDQLPNGEALYAKIGYGEVTDWSVTDAVAVLFGDVPRPVRGEDSQYAFHESLRTVLWGR